MVHASAVDRRNGQRGRRVLVVATIVVTFAAAVVGCDDSASSSDAARLDVGSPWQARPFRVPDATLQGAIRACHTSQAAIIPLASTLVLADIRGGDRIVLLYVGPRVESYTCSAVRLANGTYAMASAAGGNRRSAEGPLAAGEVRPEPVDTEADDPANGQPAATISIATGRIGKAIAGLDLLLASGSTIQTTAVNGWYTAWWPMGDGLVGYQVRARDGGPVGTPLLPSKSP
jgi:hypothetical protein